MKAFDPTTYVLSYGKYGGKTVEELPLDYKIWWLKSLLEKRDTTGINSVQNDILEYLDDLIKPEDRITAVTGATIMWFGKHDGTPIYKLPREYKLWMLGKMTDDNKVKPLVGRQEALFKYLDDLIKPEERTVVVTDDTIMWFGKHRDEKLSDVDPAYLSWLFDKLSSDPAPRYGSTDGLYNYLHDRLIVKEEKIKNENRVSIQTPDF